MSTGNDSPRAAAADTLHGAVAHDEMDPPAESRMRRLYAERREALLGAIAERAHRELVVTPRGGGLHVLAHFAPGRQRDDRDVVRRANALGLSPLPLSACFTRVPRHGGSGLLLGFAGLTPIRARAQVDRLLRAINASPLI